MERKEIPVVPALPPVAKCGKCQEEVTTDRPCHRLNCPINPWSIEAMQSGVYP
jgi:hypothetical protein